MWQWPGNYNCTAVSLLLKPLAGYNLFGGKITGKSLQDHPCLHAGSCFYYF